VIWDVTGLEHTEQKYTATEISETKQMTGT
jgi:hypothetical protein